ncbi:MarR family winged helix-turn-helix transcriptional regulator [Streptacidiphilus griseoplanus]|uniref:MarR family winged helix-turn-helix transcriptional regulator n=1 Tax=Peterkaempfera griseoplana TaxID=66896 RepID=UPI0007C80421|nr:MarR family transcriptional regulator [Peterkaempfera griseoplana]
MQKRMGPRSSDVLIDELFETTVCLRTYVDARLRGHGMSVSRLRALRTLATAPDPMRMRDLSDVLGLAARTVTTMVDALEREGLVERLPHPTDRRAYLLTLTPLGRTRHREAEEIDRDALATATGGLTGPDRERLRELLGVLRTTTAAARQEQSAAEQSAAVPGETVQAGAEQDRQNQDRQHQAERGDR